MKILVTGGAGYIGSHTLPVTSYRYLSEVCDSFKSLPKATISPAAIAFCASLTLSHSSTGHPACAGSRMTGGGFGGCTISIVRTEAVEDFKKYVLARYKPFARYLHNAV